MTKTPNTQTWIGLALATVVIFVLAGATILALRNNNNDNVTLNDLVENTAGGDAECAELTTEWWTTDAFSDAEANVEDDLRDAGCDDPATFGVTDR